MNLLRRGTTTEEIADLRRYQLRRVRGLMRENLDELNGTGKWLLSMAMTVLEKPRTESELLHHGKTARRADEYVRAIR